MAEDDDWMFDDEAEDEWLAAWAEADREAAGVLGDACEPALTASPPQPALREAAAALRTGVAAGRWPFDYFVSALGWNGPLPTDDVEMWVGALAATISPPQDPGTDPEEQSAVAVLQHPDWFGMIVGLVRRGVGASFAPEAVQRDIDTLPEVEGESEDPEGDLGVLTMAVTVLTPLWHALGVLDEDDRLTDLGCWGLPNALLVTWSGSEAVTHPDRLSEDDAAVALSILARHPMTLEDLRRELAKESVFTDVKRLHSSLVWRSEIYPFEDGVWGHIPTLADGLVLTHRLTAEERELGALDLGVDLDLWGLVALDGAPLAAGGQVKTCFRSDGPALPEDSTNALVGPDCWLDDFAAGDLLGFSYVSGSLVVELVNPPTWAEVEAEVAAVVAVAWTAAERDAVDGDPDDPGVSGAEIVLDVRRSRSGVFGTPLPPLSGLLETAGLEVELGHVGVPGTAWYGEPSWLTEHERTAYRVWVSALRKHRQTGRLPGQDELVVMAESLRGTLLDLAASDMSADPEREPVASAMAAVVAGGLAAVPLYLRARAAEGRRDVRVQLGLLEEAAVADPTSPEATADLADLRAIAGDAREAHRLYGLAGLDSGASEIAALRKFLQAPEGETGRNKPCPCGSGKKYKLCHGRSVQHPLPARAGWLWFKITAFAQRGVNREALLDWAELMSNAAREDSRTVALAMADSVTHDFAVFDGGLLADFLDFLGPLLPEDERALAETWLASDRRLLEIVEVRPVRGVLARDLLTGEEVEVLDRRVTTQVQAKDLLLGRPLPDSSGALRFRAEPVGLPRTMRSRLLSLLRADAPAEQIAVFLAPSDGTPEMRTSEGEELLWCTARYELAAPEETWGRLSAAMDEGREDELVAHADVPGRGNVVRGTITRAGSRITVQANSIERLRGLQAVLGDAGPGARLIDESTRSMESMLAERSSSSSPETPGVPTETPELPPGLMEEVIRQQEEHWLTGPIPALQGRTPHEAAGDPDLRAELEALLDDFEWADGQSPDVLTMNVPRLRRALGLTDR